MTARPNASRDVPEYSKGTNVFHHNVISGFKSAIAYVMLYAQARKTNPASAAWKIRRSPE